jgi:hypothetical protein
VHYHPEDSRSPGTIVLAVIHLLIGGVGLFAGALMTVMCFGFGGSLWDATVPIALAAGSLAYALAGVFMLLPAGRGWKTAISLQVAAVALGAIHWLVGLRAFRKYGLKVYDEEVLMFFILPTLIFPLFMLELIGIWWVGERKFGLRTLFLLFIVAAIVIGVAFTYPI